MGKYFGLVGVGGMSRGEWGEWRWVHCLIIPHDFFESVD